MVRHICYYVAYWPKVDVFYLYEIYETEGKLEYKELHQARNGTKEYSALYFMQQAQNLIKGIL
jgi:hypothetical protein